MYFQTPAHLCALLGLAAVSNGLLLQPANIQASLLANYDYVIVGAGPAGLVLANRLSEDTSITVLVLEAGPMDTRDASITLPSGVGSLVGSEYDWNLTTVAQTALDGNTRPLAQGHAVAGATIMNGMIWTRGTQADYNAWETLGNDGWGWDDMQPYFQRVERYTNNLASAEGLDVTITPDTSIYGASGSVQVGYSEYYYSPFSSFIEGNMDLGLDLVNDTNAGTTNVGVTVPPVSVAASTQTRSDARASYLDGVIDRSNLHIAPEQQVTRVILTSGAGAADPVAEGVEFTGASGALSINATREVILAAGAVWTPALMQVSGLGPTAVLQNLGIETIVDLPGVGNNLHDHGMIDPDYAYSNPTVFTKNDLTGDAMTQAQQEYANNRTGPLTATLIEAVAYMALSTLNADSQSIISGLSGADPNTYLPSDTPTEVRTGYAAQYSAIVEFLGSATEGSVEIMANSIGTIQVTSQRPLSRGYVRPASASLLDGVQVDPRWGAHPFDKDIIVMGLEWVSRLVQTTPMAQLQPNPNAVLTSGDQAQLMGVVNAELGTEFHPCGTAAMLPRESGGVVDTNLNVYGVSNLRVVNSAIIPLIPSAHLQAVVYAIAEKAADTIIAAQNENNDATTTTAATRDQNASPLKSIVSDVMDAMPTLPISF
ncbi:hypothetical protein LQW54_010800 [Pestalotiopsis sp. IQ-011]